MKNQINLIISLGLSALFVSQLCSERVCMTSKNTSDKSDPDLLTHRIPTPVVKEPVIPEDELLIRRAFSVDPNQGCDLLFRRYYQPLCSHAARFVYDKAVAEDIVAELFKAFWQKKIYERIDHSYRAYLYQAVRKNCLLYLEREAGITISTEQVLPQEVLAETLSPIDQIQFDELRERIDTIVGALSPPVRRVFLLSRFEGLKNKEIARELQISLKTVEAHLTKALARFRSVLSHE